MQEYYAYGKYPKSPNIDTVKRTKACIMVKVKQVHNIVDKLIDVGGVE